MEKWQLKELEKLINCEIRYIRYLIEEDLTNNNSGSMQYIKTHLNIWEIFNKIDHEE